MKQIAILVVSCDKYTDLWSPFTQLFDKYWADCPYKVYFSSETIKIDWPNRTPITVGEVVSWSSVLKYSLQQIEEKYILLLLDDYFLIAHSSNSEIDHAVGIMENLKAMNLQTFQFAKNEPEIAIPNENGYGIKSNDSLYRTSLQAAIWNRTMLIDFIDTNESIRDFEMIGTERSRSINNPFLSVYSWHRPLCVDYFCTAVNRGIWAREIIDLDKKENLNIDFSKRASETKMFYYKRKVYLKSPKIIQHIIDFITYRFKFLNNHL